MLDELNLSVEAGEIFGFIGPNGAGKSTTLRILLGLLKKNSGEVSIMGKDPWKEAVTLHKRLAYVPGEVRLWPKLTGGEVIDLLGNLRGNYDVDHRNELVKSFKLDPTKKCGTYSTGNLQKVALISALVSDVELYILDEPTRGLDPLMEEVFREKIRELKEDEKTVLLSSHILAEVEALCDRISIIRHGKIIETGTFSELRHLTRNSVTVECRNPLNTLENLKGVYDLKITENKAHFGADTEEIDNIIRYLSRMGINSLIITPPTLEELFIRYYGIEHPS